MDQMDRLLPYLAELGALHQQHGVSRQHLDLLGLAFCAAIRGVVQGGGVRGGHLHETTKAWITLIMAVCAGKGTREATYMFQPEALCPGEPPVWARAAVRSTARVRCRSHVPCRNS